jgi:hypothetical protein
MTAQIVELIDVQSYFNQECLNVFHFVDTTGVADPTVLVSDYVTDVIPLATAMQSDGLTHTAIRYRVVYPTAELTQEVPISPAAAGALTSDALATFYAASSKWTGIIPTVNLIGGTLPHIKKGGVRLPGMVEGQAEGEEFASAFVTAWLAWFAELKDPGTDAFLLCVASFLNGARVRQPTVTQYAVVQGTSDPSPSTQSSRKILRGRAF